MIRQDNLCKWFSLTADKAIPPVVKCISKLRCASDRFEFFSDGVKPKIASIDQNTGNIRLVTRSNQTSVTSCGTVDPVILSELQVIHHRLLVSVSKPGKDTPPDVSTKIAIRIF